MTELSGIQIRAFAENDISGALELWSNVEGLGLTESDTPETIGLFLERNPSFSAVALTPDNRIVGAVLCGHNGRAGSLYHLAVATSARGLGIGRALVTYCFERLTEAGIPRCNIFVYTDNDEGNRFWMRNEWIDPTKWKVLQKTRYAIRVTTPRDHSRTVTNSTLVVSAAFASGFMHCSEGIPVLQAHRIRHMYGKVAPAISTHRSVAAAFTWPRAGTTGTKRATSALHRHKCNYTHTINEDPLTYAPQFWRSRLHLLQIKTGCTPRLSHL